MVDEAAIELAAEPGGCGRYSDSVEAAGVARLGLRVAITLSRKVGAFAGSSGMQPPRLAQADELRPVEPALAEW